MLANADGSRKIDLIVMLSVLLLNHYVRGNDRTEVVHVLFVKQN